MSSEPTVRVGGCSVCGGYDHQDGQCASRTEGKTPNDPLAPLGNALIAYEVYGKTLLADIIRERDALCALLRDTEKLAGMENKWGQRAIFVQGFCMLMREEARAAIRAIRGGA